MEISQGWKLVLSVLSPSSTRLRRSNSFGWNTLTPAWIFPGIICLIVGILAFFTASEIEAQVGPLLFSFVVLTFLITGTGMIIAGIVSLHHK